MEMDPPAQFLVLPEDRRMYMEIKTRLERDPHIINNLQDIIHRYEDMKPRAKERISNVTELILELEQRCTIRYLFLVISEEFQHFIVALDKH